jgi:hypothetical protein
MVRPLLLLCAILFACTSLAQQSPHKRAEAAKLVEQLGSEEFQERETATRQLEELGPGVLDELRAGLKSENPETARRARELFRKAERRLDNEKVTAPTLVELNAKDQTLESILADLWKQANHQVVLIGPKADELVAKKLTLNTGGKVPFWEAVLKTCDAVELQIAGVGGIYLPSSTRQPEKPRLEAWVNETNCVVLEMRDKPRRPAAVFGAVLVEAVPVPLDILPNQPSALLQVWHEPGLRWERTTSARVTKAHDAAGVELPSQFVPEDWLDGLKRNPCQAVVRFKPGEKSATVAKELAVSISGVRRTEIEQVCQIRGLKVNQARTDLGSCGTELSILFGPDGGEGYLARIEISYSPHEVRLNGVNPLGPYMAENSTSTVHGLKVTDADGKPYTLNLSTGLTRRDPGGKRTKLILEVGMDRGKAKLGPPDTITLSGSYLKPVEVSVVLKDVALGTK